MPYPSRATPRCSSFFLRVAGLVPLIAICALPVKIAAVQTLSLQASPIAIVPIDSSDSDRAATVTGALEVAGGKAIIAVSGSITSTGQTTRVILPHRGELRVCASSSVKLAADSGASSGDMPGLLMAIDHGAIEMSFAASAANLKNADIVLTPDFRILIGGPGSADVKVRLGAKGDTCVDNGGGANQTSSSPGSRPEAIGAYVLVSSVFDGGAYRVQPGQRVMLQHGSLHEVVDQEKESCGCPPVAPKGNEFPLAQSEGLAPMPKPAPTPTPGAGGAPIQPVEPLVYNSAEHAPQPAPAVEPASTPGSSAAATAATPPLATQKKPGFFTRVGRFFRRIFGAE